MDIQIDGWSCGETPYIFLASQITITTIILYYLGGRGGGEAGLWAMDLEYLGFYIKPRVEGWGGGGLRGVQGRLFSFHFLLYHCISVARFFSSSLLLMSIYTHHQCSCLGSGTN